MFIIYRIATGTARPVIEIRIHDIQVYVSSMIYVFEEMVGALKLEVIGNIVNYHNTLFNEFKYE